MKKELPNDQINMKNIDDELLNFFETNTELFQDEIIDFLNERKDWSDKREKASSLLKSVAENFGKGEVYATLIEENLRIYEEAVRKTLPQHRDHFVHSAYVFLLGLYIYKKNVEYRSSVNRGFTMNYPIGGNTVYQSDKEFRLRWAITSIFHDLAYPLEILTLQMNKYLGDVIKENSESQSKNFIGFDIFNFIEITSFGYLPSEDSPLNQSHFNTREMGKYMRADNVFDMIACNLSFKYLNYSYETIRNIIIKKFQEKIRTGFIDHGIMSAIVLAKWLIKLYSERRWYPEQFYCSIGDCLGAIALHTSQNWLPKTLNRKISMDKHPIAYLLVLCDELQEWCRPLGREIESNENIMSKIEGFKLLCKNNQILIDFNDKTRANSIIKKLNKRLEGIPISVPK